MPYVRAGDIRVYYEIHGAGPPLALFNGLGGNLATWDPEFIDGLATRFRTLVFDNRGTGRSEKPDDPYSIRMFAADAAVLLDVLQIRRAHVFGASMGGMIAQQFALDHPERVDRLVLCCTTPGGPQSTPPSLETLQAIANTDGLAPAALARRNRQFSFMPDFLATHADYLDAKLTKETEYPTPPHALAHHFAAAVHFNVFERLAEITAETLVMTGREDLMVPAPNSMMLAQRIPRADLIVFAAAGHGVLTERRTECLAAIIGFLTRTNGHS